MARLPQPGGDEGTWGSLLNDYLSVSHDSGGAIKADAIDAAALQDGAVSGSKLQDNTITDAKLDTSNAPSSGQVLSYNGSGLAWANGGAGGDPTMGGDLSGLASNAQIVVGAVGAAELATNAVTTIKIADANVTDAKLASGIAQSKVTNLMSDLAGKQPLDGDLTAIAALTPTNDDLLQRKAGAWTNRTPAQVKTDLALTKADVGLANVDNTSDANKPISTATQTALDAKVTANAGITGATHTKITYDAKGLVTAGSDATQDDITDGVTFKQYSGAEKTKLAGIATGATANSSDATLLNRANHTGTQTASTISDFSTAADARIAASSINALSDVTLTAPSSGQVLKYDGSAWINDTDAAGGVTDGDKGDITVSGSGATWTIDAAAVTGAKIAATTITDANISASAAIVQSKIQNLVSDLAAKVATATTITAGTGLTGGGDLSANRTISANFGTAAGTIAQGNDSRITGAEQTANKGAANGYASLNSSTLVPTAQLGTGTADGTTYLRGDGTWATPAGGGVTPINGGGETYYDAGNGSTAVTLNLVNGNIQKVTLNAASCTVTLTSPAAGAMRAMTLLVFQDGVGSRTITWPAAVKWGAAGTPVLSTGAGKMDIVSLFTVDGGTNWYGALGAKGY